MSNIAENVNFASSSIDIQYFALKFLANYNFKVFHAILYRMFLSYFLTFFLIINLLYFLNITLYFILIHETFQIIIGLNTTIKRNATTHYS